MKNTKSPLLVMAGIGIALFSSGCATHKTLLGIPDPSKEPATLAQRCDEWKKSDINDLMVEIGAPSESFKMPNGSTIYTYNFVDDTERQRGFVLLSRSGFGYGGGAQEKNRCMVEFVVNASNEIVSSRHAGNICTSALIPARKNSKI